MPCQTKIYVEGLPDYKLQQHGTVCFSIGAEEFCMSIPTFRAWAEHARQFLSEMDEAAAQPVPLRKVC